MYNAVYGGKYPIFHVLHPPILVTRIIFVRLFLKGSRADPLLLKKDLDRFGRSLCGFHPDMDLFSKVTSKVGVPIDVSTIVNAILQHTSLATFLEKQIKQVRIDSKRTALFLPAFQGSQTSRRLNLMMVMQEELCKTIFERIISIIRGKKNRTSDEAVCKYKL